MLSLSCVAAALAPLPVLPPRRVSYAPYREAIARHEPRREDKKLLAALRNWLKAYRQGKLAVGDDYRNIAGKSLARKAGIITKAMFQRDNGVLKPGQFSYREEIAVLLSAAGKDGSAKAAAQLLEFCAIGLDTATNYTPAMVPFHLRQLAEVQLDAADAAGSEWLATIATGEQALPVSKRLHAAIRAAATAALGRRDKTRHAAVLHRCLGDAAAVVRLAACQPLGASGDAANLSALVSALTRESTPAVKQRLHLWIARLISSCNHKVDAGAAGRAAELLARDLEAAKSWHLKTQLVELMHVHGRTDYVPRLIHILECCQAEPRHLHDGRLSGVLRHTTHQQLVRLTGAHYAMDQAEAWRDYWTRVQKGFTIATATDEDIASARANWRRRENQRRAAAGETSLAETPGHRPGAGMARADFFGIPVRGSNILFILDVGYATRLTLPITSAEYRTRWGDRCKRIDVMKLETTRALASLGSDTQFNVIAYSDRCRMAFKQPMVANAKAILAGKRFVTRQSPQKNYNLGAALVLALSATRLRPDAPTPAADEVFLVANHMNQFGAIKSPDDLVGLVSEACQHAKTRIHTVYLGSINDQDDKGELGLTTMRRIAAATGGQFIRP